MKQEDKKARNNFDESWDGKDSTTINNITIYTNDHGFTYSFFKINEWRFIMKHKKIMSLLMAAAFIIPFFNFKISVKAETSGQPSTPVAVGQPYQTTHNGQSVTAQDYEVTVPYIDPDTTKNYYEKGYQDANEVLNKVSSTVTSTVNGQSVIFNKTSDVTFREDDVHGKPFPKTVPNTMTVNCGTADAYLGKYISKGYSISYSDILNSFQSPISDTLVDANTDGSYNGNYALVWRGDKDYRGIPILAAEPYQGFYPSPEGSPAALKRRPYKVIKPFSLLGTPFMTQKLTTQSYPIFINLPVGQKLDKNRYYEFNAITSNFFKFNYTATKVSDSETHTSYTLLSKLMLDNDNNLKFYYKDYYDSAQYTTRDIVTVNGSVFSDAGNVTSYDMYGNARTFHRYTATINLGYIIPSASYSYQAQEDLWLPTVTYRGTAYSTTPIPQSHNLTVHYIDKDTGSDIDDKYNQSEPIYSFSSNWFYSLTGNYRTSANGMDTAFNYNNGTEISVDLSSSNKTIYVMCQKNIPPPPPSNRRLHIKYKLCR